MVNIHPQITRNQIKRLVPAEEQSCPKHVWAGTRQLPLGIAAQVQRHVFKLHDCSFLPRGNRFPLRCCGRHGWGPQW